jgi:hypothetical protein
VPRSWSACAPAPAVHLTAQNSADRLIGDVISQIGERPDNPIIAPGSIFLGHPHNQFLDFFVDWRSARTSVCTFGPIYVDGESQRRMPNAGTRRRSPRPDGYYRRDEAAAPRRVLLALNTLGKRSARSTRRWPTQ